MEHITFDIKLGENAENDYWARGEVTVTVDGEKRVLGINFSGKGVFQETAIAQCVRQFQEYWGSIETIDA